MNGGVLRHRKIQRGRVYLRATVSEHNHHRQQTDRRTALRSIVKSIGYLQGRKTEWGKVLRHLKIDKTESVFQCDNEQEDRAFV